MPDTYHVVYDANTKIEMNRAEVQKFLKEIQTNDVVEFKGNFLTKFFRVIARAPLTEGRLHDGTPVIKHFDRWVDKFNIDVRLDVDYYPELAKDEIMSEDEYQEKIKKIEPPKKYEKTKELA